MALIAKHENRFGQKVKHYWRYNGLLTSANRQPDGAMSVPTVALFRAYSSPAAFRAGCFEWMEERTVSFVPTSANADMAAEAYAAFKAAEPPAEFLDQLARITDAVAQHEAAADQVEAALAEAHDDVIAADRALAAAGDGNDALGARIVARRAADRVAQLVEQGDRAAAMLAASQAALATATAEKAIHDAWTAVMSKAEQA